MKWKFTVFNVFRPDTTDRRPVVCHLLPGLNVFVVDAVTKVIDDGNPGQDAVLAAEADTHHLTIHSDNTSRATSHEHFLNTYQY